MYRNGYSYIRQSDNYNNLDADPYLLDDVMYLLGNENIWYNTSDNKFYVHVDFRHNTFKKDGGEYTVEYKCKEIHIKDINANTFTKVMDISNNNEDTGVDIQLDSNAILSLDVDEKYTFKIKLIDDNGNIDIQRFVVIAKIK
jgi:hypothetical protein